MLNRHVKEIFYFFYAYNFFITINTKLINNSQVNPPTTKKIIYNQWKKQLDL